MIDKEKAYLGMLNDPLLAALLYDTTIIQTKGLQAKVNFKFTRYELYAILFEKSIIKIKKEYDRIAIH